MGTEPKGKIMYAPPKDWTLTQSLTPPLTLTPTPGLDSGPEAGVSQLPAGRV